MKNSIIGILVGAMAGTLDVIPMVLQNLTWDANLSAFSLWLVVGFLISVTNINIPSWLKGIVLAFLVLTPSAIIIGAQEPETLIPISFFTLILGALSGYTFHKIVKKLN
jgi:hypothetical protein